MVSQSLCISCGACVEACPQGALALDEGGITIGRERCDGCGECAAVCYAEALAMTSMRITVDEILERVERDQLFYEASGGGITLCGGEPLAQPAFAAALLRASKERGLHTAIETGGHYEFAALEAALPYLDFVYYDLKGMDPAAHKRLTGANNRLVLENLRRLDEYDVEVCVRVPVIPTLNDSDEGIEAMAQFVKEIKAVRSVELLPYHKLGVNKYAKLGWVYPLDEVPTPEDGRMRELAAIFERHGVPCIVGGW